MAKPCSGDARILDKELGISKLDLLIVDADVDDRGNGIQLMASSQLLWVHLEATALSCNYYILLNFNHQFTLYRTTGVWTAERVVKILWRVFNKAIGKTPVDDQALLFYLPTWLRRLVKFPHNIIANFIVNRWILKLYQSLGRRASYNFTI